MDSLIGGGLPRGRWSEIVGEAGSGRTSLALYICKAAEMLGLETAWWSVVLGSEDHRTRRLKMGMTGRHLPLRCSEELRQLVRDLSQVDLLVIDDVGHLRPLNDASHEVRAHVNGKAFAALRAVLRKTGTAALFVNQLLDDRPRGFANGKPFRASMEGTIGKFAAVRFRTVLDHRRDPLDQIWYMDPVSGRRSRGVAGTRHSIEVLSNGMLLAERLRMVVRAKAHRDGEGIDLWKVKK